MIEEMLDDIGITDTSLRAAATRWLVQRADEIADIDARHLQHEVSCFCEGYRFCHAESSYLSVAPAGACP